MRPGFCLLLCGACLWHPRTHPLGGGTSFKNSLDEAEVGRVERAAADGIGGELRLPRPGEEGAGAELLIEEEQSRGVGAVRHLSGGEGGGAGLGSGLLASPGGTSQRKGTVHFEEKKSWK